ncbi:MAG: hypothetical protein JF603_01940 [Acidobacteria bacterium]|nr:hypothetical protein [Acidobacteriota bacterium]
MDSHDREQSTGQLLDHTDRLLIQSRELLQQLDTQLARSHGGDTGQTG